MSSRKQKIRTSGELWIGLAKVSQTNREGVLGAADAAYTNAIGLAKGKVGFRAAVSCALADLGLSLRRLENAETLKARLSKYSLEPELTTIAKTATQTGVVCFGTFHAFDIK